MDLIKSMTRADRMWQINVFEKEDHQFSISTKFHWKWYLKSTLSKTNKDSPWSAYLHLKSAKKFAKLLSLNSVRLATEQGQTRAITGLKFICRSSALALMPIKLDATVHHREPQTMQQKEPASDSKTTLNNLNCQKF